MIVGITLKAAELRNLDLFLSLPTYQVFSSNPRNSQLASGIFPIPVNIVLRADNFHVHDTISNIETASQHILTYMPIWAGCGGLSNLWGTACLLNDTRANGNYGIYNERHPRSVSERPFALSIPSHSDCIFLLGKKYCGNCRFHTGKQAGFSEIGTHFQGPIPQSYALLCTVRLSPVPH